MPELSLAVRDGTGRHGHPGPRCSAAAAGTVSTSAGTAVAGLASARSAPPLSCSGLRSSTAARSRTGVAVDQMTSC